MDYSSLPAREIERHARSVAPGAWLVDNDRPLATLLGSCVAVCMYDLEARVGGMNHFMLPNLARDAYSDVDALLAGDYCMEALFSALMKKGARKARLVAKAFGGGTILQLGEGFNTIGRRNAEFAKEWLERQQIPLVATDLLGPWSRKLIFLPTNGDAWSRRMVSTMVDTARVAQEEKAYAESLAKVKKPKGGPKVELF